jgi:UDPglucose--hexose-1-phosphate uridylyltransferase
MKNNMSARGGSASGGKKSEIRKDYFLEKYVVITPGRAKRPFEMKEETVTDRSGLCDFCPENIDKKMVVDQIKIGKKWAVISLKNIYPAVSIDNKNAYGIQEVIIETPNHAMGLGRLSEKEIGLVLQMYAKRTKAIAKDKKINYILCFKNKGAKAGASKVHAHSQVFATQMLPPDIQEEIVEADLYQANFGTCPYCDIIKQEIKSPRKIYADRNIVAIAPFASQYHYEAWLFTKRHLDNITQINGQELKSLAKALKKILSRLHAHNFAYNLFLHQVISDETQHFYIKIQPRDSVWAGVELGSGLVINSIAPEEAAKFYKK